MFANNISGRFGDYQKYLILPFPVELVSLSLVNPPEFLLKVRGEVYGGVEILPDEGVMFHVPTNIMTLHSKQSPGLLDEVLLGHIACGEVTDPVDRHDTDIFNSS